MGLLGVPGPLLAFCCAAGGGCGMNRWPAASMLEDPGPTWFTEFCSLPVSTAEALFRGSLTLVVEELGVPTFELFGDRESAPTSVEACEPGDAVPPVPSFFFDDLLESFALESCSC